VPAIPWKATPTNGIVRGTVTRQAGGTAVYNASISISTTPVRNQKTEPHGKFAFFETTPGAYTITATATDLGVATTNVTLTAGTNFAVSLVLPPDATPPVITGVGTSNLTDTAVIIKWTTDESADSAVDYGLTVSYGATVSNATTTLNHAVSLTNLTPNTLYHYRGLSRNVTGLQTNSADFTFTTHPLGVVDDLIVEARLGDGNLNSSPPYSDNASFNDSTLKSTAAGLTGTGSRYAISGTPAVTVKPALPAAGGTYEVYITQGSATSISTNIIVAVGQSGCTGLPATTTLFQQSGGNTWEYLGRMRLNAGVTVPTLTFTYSGGTFGVGNRMYSDATKYVFIPPPTITNQPQGRTVNRGANALFTVGATGTTPLNYQWRFTGTNLVNATASSYTRANAQTGDSGAYSVVITNIAGVVTSASAMLAVTLPLPTRFQAITLLPDGRARMVLTGEPGAACAIEGSSNLAGWFELLSQINTNGTLEVMDHSASNSSRRFYRARQ
jgi:hypothetical protein